MILSDCQGYLTSPFKCCQTPDQDSWLELLVCLEAATVHEYIVTIYYYYSLWKLIHIWSLWELVLSRHKNEPPLCSVVDLQHSFIRDVHDMHPLIALVSEANAEVEYEEKDIDDVVSILLNTIKQCLSTAARKMVETCR